MRGSRAVLAVFAVLSVGLRSSGAPGELRGAAAGNRSSGPGRTTCPDRCRCEEDGLRHRTDCSDLGLREVPNDLSVFTSFLDLSMNNLTLVSGGLWSKLHFLEELRLAGNHLSFIPRGAFDGLYNLKVLMLQNNQLKSVPAEVFNTLHNLQSLEEVVDEHGGTNIHTNIYTSVHSYIHTIYTNIYANVHSYVHTNVHSYVHTVYTNIYTSDVQTNIYTNVYTNVYANVYTNVYTNVFTNVYANFHSYVHTNVHTNVHSYVHTFFCFVPLRDLNYNSLVEFPSAVRSLSHLKELGFHSNNIQSIPEHAFTGNPSLISIFFYNNPIQSVGRSAFQNLPELRTLSLNGAANLTDFPDLTGTKSLESLTITEARITYLPASMCDQLPNLQLLDLSFNRIQIVPSFSGCENIQKMAGPFHPCLRLLGSWMIRGGVWLMAAVSLVGNSLVILIVFFSPASSATPPKLLIGLLAVVNGLTGVWGGWLAALDAWTFGSFWRFVARWESSFLCRLSGFLCVFASQTGLFLLTLAALERCLAANGAARSNKNDGRNGRSSSPLVLRLSVGLCFLLGGAVTLPPLMDGRGSTSFCLPLPSSSSSSSGAFSVSLVLFDSLCFLAMTLAYIHLYCRANKAPPPSEEEAALTRHVTWLLFADCLLFLPVAFLSFSSLLRLHVAGPEAAKGVLLLVAPLPACVNPLLYLLFSPLAREELLALSRCTCVEAGPLTPRRRRAAEGRQLGSTDDDDVEKQSCDSTQALVGVGGGKEEGEGAGPGRGGSKTQQSRAFVAKRL
ncbi:leucine-rich repeat-containing G-protein coupled receptor 5A [Austrofundulus limnaeus]|uniref:Leucine-rich repeat-containing G-protein coupled receptor 5A n=1 Tax=Austrofundulus limnaeus TaxID=52670 RepID=A0A2I4CWU3_AUSLI|nr:PREDICTED: leucine-rich repeat-containing G-protein coupled receptor 5A-like [Austrofundulus limnaeus]